MFLSGGEQGAQHSQSLHSWFSHIPGLKVVMPYSALDARDLLISSVLADDPVIYMDDRWLNEEEIPREEIKLIDLKELRLYGYRNKFKTTSLIIPHKNIKP